jgi:hypothetical protein
MTSLMTRNKLTLAVALLLTCAGSGWLTAAGDTTTTSTYAMLVAVVAGLVAVASNAWKTGQTDDNVEPRPAKVPAVQPDHHAPDARVS